MKSLLKLNKVKIAKGIKVGDIVLFGDDKDNEFKNIILKYSETLITDEKL